LRFSAQAWRSQDDFLYRYKTTPSRNYLGNSTYNKQRIKLGPLKRVGGYGGINLPQTEQSRAV